jgi:sulfopyruvate decarboxylase alpha subunit
MSSVASDTWQQELGRALVSAGVEAFAWVPDRRLAPIVEALTGEGLTLRTLTREEECFGWAAGFRAAGGMPLVLSQCSGLGNSLNVLGSLVLPYGLGFPLVMSMRGHLGERNPAQIPFGRVATDMLDLLGVESFSIRTIEDVPAVVKGALDLAEGARRLAPIVLDPQLR